MRRNRRTGAPDFNGCDGLDALYSACYLFTQNAQPVTEAVHVLLCKVAQSSLES
jgi:hypothetical protein